MHQNKLTIPDIKNRKHGTPISELTAYDYPWARLVDGAGIDIVLVGDSLGMVVLGYPDTVSVTMEEMIHHTKAVVRGVKRALVVTDMPFGSYNSSIQEAIRNATRLLKEGRADAVKVEGGVEMADTVAAIVRAGIPVQGHIGLTRRPPPVLAGLRFRGRVPGPPNSSSKMREPWKTPGAFPWCWRRFLPLWPNTSPERSLSPPSVLVPGRAVTGRSWSSMTQSVFMTVLPRSLSSSTPNSMSRLSEPWNSTRRMWKAAPFRQLNTVSP